jgi:polysaccharide pyruvyl transferase WcaK-like protein
MVNFFRMKKTKSIVVLNDTSYESHHGCILVMSNLKKLAYKNNLKILSTNPTGKDWKQNKSILRQIPKCDLVLVNGEGTLHDAQPVARDLITIAKYVKDKYKIPVVLINSTYQNNGPLMAKYTRYFDLIYVRETLSKKDLDKYNIKSKVVPDLSFYTKFKQLKKNKNLQIGVTDSTYKEECMWLLRFAIKNNYKYFPILTFPKIKIEKIRTLVSFLRFKLFKQFIPLLKLSSINFPHKIQKMFFYADHYENYINEISNLNFLIVARYHTLCFALKTQTPFVALEKESFRMRGLLDDIGIGRNRIKRSLYLNKIKLEKFNFNKFTKKEKERIRAYTESAPQKIDVMFREILNLIEFK